MLKLGVNIDHVATVRQARRGEKPSIIEAAKNAINAGCFGITAHLREDRRHIQDQDIIDLKSLTKFLNFEMAVTPEMVKFALTIQPNSVCLVPEKREELTTEGGLNLFTNQELLQKSIISFKEKNILVSLFIDADELQIKEAARLGADYIELHTGTFANAQGNAQLVELEKLKTGAILANSLGLKVNAGHGIDYENIELIKEIPFVNELNIGHSIIAHAISVGMFCAVREMLEKMRI